MALLLPDRSYVKLDLNGHYEVYKNKTARNKNKKITHFSIVLEKYNEILRNYTSQSAERFYYDGEAVLAEFTAWESEFNKYSENLQLGNDTESYPLMKEYIPDVDDTIPTLVSSGVMCALASDTLEEVYNKAKEYEVFGPKDEVKDI